MARIKTLHIENFRSIKCLDVKFDKLNALLGPNNAGKSNIMRALAIILGETWPTNRSIDDKDFFNRDVNNTIKIQVMFDTSFYDPKSKKQIFGFEFSHHKDEASFLALDDAGKRLTYFNSTPVRVSSEMRDEVPLIYVDIDRQSSQQLRSTQWTLYGKTLKFLGTKISESKKKQFKDSVGGIFNSEIFNSSSNPNLKDLEEKLNKSVNDLTGLGLGLRLDILDPIDAIRNVRPYFVDNNTSSVYDSEEMGAGTQSALSVAIARAYGDIVKKNVVLAIEEPELHLHPQACRNFYNNLKSLSENEIQVIYTTHSQYFVDISLFKSLYIVRNENSQTTVASALELELTDSNQNSLITKFNEEVNQSLFAEAAILVEGASDAIACKAMLEKLEFNIDQHNVSVVDCGGINNIIHILKVLTAINIKTIVLVDKDPGNDSTLSRIKRLKAVVHENNLHLQIPNLEGLFSHPEKFKKKSALKFFQNFEQDIPKVYYEIISEHLKSHSSIT